MHNYLIKCADAFLSSVTKSIAVAEPFSRLCASYKLSLSCKRKKTSQIHTGFPSYFILFKVHLLESRTTRFM